MPLPHYQSSSDILPNPIYSNLFECFLISTEFVLFQEIFDNEVQFLDNETESLINLSFTINEDFIINFKFDI